MKSKKFVRRDTVRFSKLGKKRKKIQKWRGAKGRDNKIRLSLKGYPKAPAIGYKKQKTQLKEQDIVYNIKDLEQVNKKSQIVLARVGVKKKLEIIKKAQDLGLSLLNVKQVNTK
jgi:large subunit ribosomal protein L32e